MKWILTLIVQPEPILFARIAVVLRKYGIEIIALERAPLPDSTFEQWRGVVQPTRDNMTVAMKKLERLVPIVRIEYQQKKQYTHSMPQVIIFDFFGVVFDPRTGQPMTGLVEFLQRVRRRSIKCGIASSSSQAHILEFLRAHSLESYFEVVIGLDQVAVTKPDPECYQRVAEFFRVQPSECFIIDDSAAALEQAAAAGFQTLFFGNGKSGLDNFEKIATLMGL